MHHPSPVRPRLLVAVIALLLVAAACSSESTDAEDAVDDEPAEANADEATQTVDVAISEDPAADEATEPTQAVGDSTNPSAALANDEYLGSYTLVVEEFGTEVTVTIVDDARIIEANALPNHTTGDFPNAGNPNTISEQAITYAYTTAPVYTGQALELRTVGVALNGVKFEPGTAEVVECASGESYRIEGLQGMFDLGMDFNNAHVQPTGEYHYHGASELLVDAFADGEDLVLVGFAADGHLVYYSKSGAYSSSYQLATDARTGTDCTYRGDTIDIDDTAADGTYTADWVYVEGSGDLDQCNGTEIDGEYAYLMTEEYPFIQRCVMGEAESDGPPPGRRP